MSVVLINFAEPSSGKGGPRGNLGEEIVGQVPVVAQLALGFENLSLVLTTRRLVVAHRGKKGVAALASVPVLGKFALDRLEREKTGSGRRQSDLPLAVDEILRADKDNFQVNYDDIVMVEVGKSGSSLRIVILTRDDKFEFTTGQTPRLVENVLRTAFGSKLLARTLH